MGGAPAFLFWAGAEDRDLLVILVLDTRIQD